MAKRVKKKIKQSSGADKNQESQVQGSHLQGNDEATIYDSPELLQERIGRSQALIEENKNVVVGIAVGLVAILVAAFFWNQYTESTEQEAQTELAPAIFYFEKDSLGKALEGDNNTTIGLLGVAEDYSGTGAGNLANFYIGAAYLKQGKFDEAIGYLEDFSSGDVLVQARAYSLIGDAYMEKEDYQSAISFYEKAADYKPNPQFTPSYLMKLGLAYEMAGNMEQAKASYQSIVEDFPQSREVNNAKKSIAAL